MTSTTYSYFDQLGRKILNQCILIFFFKVTKYLGFTYTSNSCIYKLSCYGTIDHCVLSVGLLKMEHNYKQLNHYERIRSVVDLASKSSFSAEKVFSIYNELNKKIYIQN